MFASLLHTPAAQALLLAAAGALAFWLRDVPGLALSWIKRFFITTLTLDSRDEFLFAALVEYMDLHPALRQVNQFTARSVRQGSAHQSLEDDCAPARRHAPTSRPVKGCTFCASTADGCGFAASCR